ncbi:hypothetical protein BP5796_04823 [Coleophoma crateriformis]|uniref:Uncharacterized protein n=1 Tax=Coleophoma crateriformis TaxID=565419 RepID=A0A3D8SAC9_9HELO|nr:hypothetical protein BP5796_04823 [Coleophoma crateriformis]
MDTKDNVELVASRLSPSLSRHNDEGARSTATGTPVGIRSSPPAMTADIPKDVNMRNGSPETSGVKSDSEAETIVLPGKDGHSPSKIRKAIKHEDKSEDEDMRNASDIESAGSARKAAKDAEVVTTSLGKRKRSKHGDNKEDPSAAGNSSGLSSVPTSPVAPRRSSLSKAVASESDISKSPSPRPVREAKSVDRVFSRRKPQGNDEDHRSARSVNHQGAGQDRRRGKEHRNSSRLSDTTSRQRTRSNSPPSRSHKRSVSTQLPSGSSNGLSYKKKRVPAPLQSTEHQSDDSSASEGSHPRSSRLRHLAAPTTGESVISPAKMPHKKRVDPHGSTPLARACSIGNLEQAKQRLQERPDDLNMPDYSGNTPLQSASLKGHDHIVAFLLNAGCVIDSVNEAQDTPLLDAVDNDHLEVVKLLLQAGANPHKANIHGEEPIDRVDKDSDDAEEMKAAINAAKLNYRIARRASEEDDGRLSHPTESPRQTPPIQTPQQQAFGFLGRRGGGGRAVKTSNDLLYRSSDVNELRRAAGMNEVENVARILELKQGKNGWNDPETLINAAKGGHIGVLNILLAMGDFDPDPDPLSSMPARFATPMLAAIGRDGKDWLPVIQLLVSQPAFNPTRKINGETYAQIARKRRGAFWEEEADMLESAAEKYKKSHKSSPNSLRSPGLRRDGNRDNKRVLHEDTDLSSRVHKRRVSSPKSKDIENRNGDGVKIGDNKHGHQRSDSSTSQVKDVHTKRGPGRPKKEGRTPSVVASDRETTPLGPPKQKLPQKKSESEVPTAASDTETVKPRRKLVSGKDLKGERERQRRASIASNASNVSVKEKPSLGDSKSGSLNRTPHLSATDLDIKMDVSKHDRARSLKRDDSKDRLSAIRGESPVKRHRSSVTPPRMSGSESGEGSKRRKLDSEGKERRKGDTNLSSSPDHRTNSAKSGLARERTGDKKDGDHRKQAEESGKGSKVKRMSTPSDLSKEQKAATDDRERDVVMDEAPLPQATSDKEREARVRREKDEKEVKRKAEADKKAEIERRAEAEKKAEAERKIEIERKQEAQKKLEEEKRIEAEKAAEAIKKAEAEKKLEAERIEQARQAHLAREKQLEEEEAKRQQEEAERRELQRQKDAEAQHRAQEERQRLYLEQQRVAKEEQERRRRDREAEQRAEKLRIAQEKEKERMEKLPFILRWLEKCPNPHTQEIVFVFRELEGFRADTIKPELTGQPGGRDQWLLNLHVAILLGEKDLSLSRFTSWEKIPLNLDAKKSIYVSEQSKYALSDSRLKIVREDLLGDEYDNRTGKPLLALNDITRPLFHGMEMFFVKLSDFMFHVPNFPHLRGVEMIVNYCELLPFPRKIPSDPAKWKQDPGVDTKQGWPRHAIWKDGIFIKQAEQRRSTLKTYDQFVHDQQQRLTTQNSPTLSTVNPPPLPATNGQHVNGITPPSSDKSVNGGSPHHAEAHIEAAPGLVNGIISSHTENPTMIDTNHP